MPWLASGSGHAWLLERRARRRVGVASESHHRDWHHAGPLDFNPHLLRDTQISERDRVDRAKQSETATQTKQTKQNPPLIYACKLYYSTHPQRRTSLQSPTADSQPLSSSHIFLQLLRLLQQLFERERRKRPPAKLGKLGERLDPRQTQRVKL